MNPAALYFLKVLDVVADIKICMTNQESAIY